MIYSEWVRLNLITGKIPPAGAPTNFRSQVLGPFSARLTWDIVLNSYGYQLERSINSDFSNSILVYEGVDLNFIDSDLLSETTYYYRLRTVFNENSEDYDVKFTEFGASNFYQRADRLNTNGTTLTRNDGGNFDESYVGKKVNIKQCDNIRYPGRVVSWYGVIESIIDKTTAVLQQAPPIPANDELGYFFADNSNAFKAALVAANESGSSRYRILVDSGTYVIPETFSPNLSNGGFAFICPTEATFKIFREEEPYYNKFFGFIKFGSFNSMGDHNYEFININLVGADNYSYYLQNDVSVFRFPQSGKSNVAPIVKIINNNENKEKVELDESITEYLVRKGYVGTELIRQKELRFNWALPERFKVKSLGKTSGATITKWAEIHLINHTPVITQAYTITISNILSNAGLKLFIDGYHKFKGVHTEGRLGLMDNLNTKAKVNVLPDIDGDYTILQISNESDIEYSFDELHNQYDQYFWKRDDVEIDFKLGFAGRDLQKMFVHNSKPYGSQGVEIGTIQDVDDIGNGIYEVLIDNIDEKYSDFAETGREKVNGLVQYDNIISDNNGSLSKVFANNTNSLVDLTGQARDYRGWCVYKYGDTFWKAESIGITGRSEDYYTDKSLSSSWRGAIDIYVDSNQCGAEVGDTISYINPEGSIKTAYIKTITPAKFGYKIRLWLNETGITISYTDNIPNGQLIKVGEKILGTTLFVSRVQTGNRINYPNGYPFVKGEKLYCFDLGTGDAAGVNNTPCRYSGNMVILPKFFALDKEYNNVFLDYFFYGRNTETHFIYTSNAFQGEIKDWTSDESALFTRFIRKQNSGSGYDIIGSGGFRRFINVYNKASNSIEGQWADGQVIVIDGGDINISTSNPIHTYNTPRISGTINGTINSKDGTGYYLNNVFYGK